METIIITFDFMIIVIRILIAIKADFLKNQEKIKQ